MKAVPDVIERAASRLAPDTRAVLLFLYRRSLWHGRPCHRPATPTDIVAGTRLPRGAVIPALGELFGMGLTRLSLGRGYVASPDLERDCERLLQAEAGEVTR